MLDYLKLLKNVQVSVHRLKFLRNCLKNDPIQYFLKFREFFLYQTVHYFQLNFLRTESFRANEDTKGMRRCL